MKKVSVLEVKRCFVLSNLVKTPPHGEKYLGQLTREEFLKRLGAAKKKLARMTPRQLDKLVGYRYKKRLRAYNSMNWVLTEMKVSDLGVWRGAGGLPVAWTKGSLAQTARHVKGALASQSSFMVKRSAHAIPNIVNSPIVLAQREKYLLPIAFQGGSGTNGRRGLQKMKADLDDGCMRSIALAIKGKKKLRLYFGIPKKSPSLASR